MKEIVNDVVPRNVFVIISGIKSENGTTPDFDCVLATKRTFLDAHGLRLGARIYGSPTGKINSNKEQFQIPSGYNAVMVLRFENTD